MSLWKKILIGIGLFFLLCLLFWKTIYATFLYIGIEHVFLQHRLNLDQEMMSTTLAPSTTAKTLDTVAFQSIDIPVTFPQVDERVATTLRAIIGEEKSILVSEGIAFREILTTNKLEVPSYSETIHPATCDLFAALNPSVCNSNYDFGRTLLSLNGDSASLFSDKKTKLAYTILGLLKSVYVAGSPDIMYEFETFEIRGLYFNHSATAAGHPIIWAYIFDKNDQSYDLVFKGLPQAEVDYILNNIRTQQ